MAKGLLGITETLRKKANGVSFSAPVAFVYNPLDYAGDMARAYLERFGKGPKEALILGMNPGPFGMAQTGVPFGQIAAVRDYLGLGDLADTIGQPKKMHPKKPVLGLGCTRSEVSGDRLWGAIKETHPKPKTFFARALVVNYCPLLFLDEKGANVTPDKIARAERNAIEAVCDEALEATVKELSPKLLIGVGGYAAKCFERVTGREVVTIPHPSPASPLANRGWAAAARAALDKAGVHGLM